jgi:hypothetical protein
MLVTNALPMAGPSLDRLHDLRGCRTLAEQRQQPTASRSPSGGPCLHRDARAYSCENGPAERAIDNRRNRHNYMARPTLEEEQPIPIAVVGNELQPG